MLNKEKRSEDICCVFFVFKMLRCLKLIVKL